MRFGHWRYHFWFYLLLVVAHQLSLFCGLEISPKLIVEINVSLFQIFSTRWMKLFSAHYSIFLFCFLSCFLFSFAMFPTVFLYHLLFKISFYNVMSTVEHISINIKYNTSLNLQQQTVFTVLNWPLCTYRTELTALHLTFCTYRTALNALHLSNCPYRTVITGEADCLIRLQWGESTATALLQNDRDVQFKVYPGVEHEIRQDEVRH